MKIDPNQLVGGCVETVVTFTNPNTGEQTVKDKHVGGIPLRLEIAARLFASAVDQLSIWAADDQKHRVKNAAEYALIWADALIAAHNATAGEVAGG